MEHKEFFKWPPLESDPLIFNKYFQDIGLSPTYSFDELYSLDYKEIQIVDPPVYGVIVAIRRPKGRYYIPENILNWKDLPFFINQTYELDMACGLIAGMHVLGNHQELLDVDSPLRIFFDKCKDLPPEQRSQVLEKSNEFKEKHIQYSSEGQSAMPFKQVQQQQQIIYHYTSFINYKGSLIELDGTLDGPVLVKQKSYDDTLLDNVIGELRKRLDLGVIEENLSVLFLTGSQ